ncbi:hypothetical protein FOC1_g10005480 [Fusarium oxysporum f. sp. cubense race 1]|uniref:Uncharacterized protein n=1 Tax=Fusarium oxysporum f. sp. cubense (strain race 1) TaxID=1229664 RepID=N4V3B1_FUSC1|nr:hypothetical protein FOC1_g10005480 [Fusarium oxysporum f. sp. cubense race 1]
MAMRPDRPGVQTFRVYDPELDNPGHAEDVMGFAINNGTPRMRWSLPSCLHRLALPLWNKYPDSIDGTSNHNISTYLIDSSLWTACQESRSMMKRGFRTNKTSSKSFLGSRTAY